MTDYTTVHDFIPTHPKVDPELAYLRAEALDAWRAMDAAADFEVLRALLVRALDLEEAAADRWAVLNAPAESCSCSTADAAGVSGGPCVVCRAETQTDEIPFLDISKAAWYGVSPTILDQLARDAGDRGGE